MEQALVGRSWSRRANGAAVALAAQPAALAELQGQPARLLVAVDIPRAVRACRCSPSSSPTTGLSSPPTRASCCFRSSSTTRRRNSAASYAVTDYRDPVIQDEINANGWMVWPPIRYSYRTVNNEIPKPRPPKPSWLLLEGRRAAAPIRKGVDDPNCTIGNWNWLGTDDQARDVLARVIYGFRISVLFGLILTLGSAVLGVSAGAVQGYFGGWTDLLFQRFIEIWSAIPVLYLLLIVAAVLPPGFFILLGLMLLFSWTAFVGVVRAEFLRARNFEYVNAARALGVSNLTIMFRHLLPNAMVATLTFLPFILNGSITTLTSLDFLGFGLPPGSAIARRNAAPGPAQPQCPLARHLGLRRHLADAVAADLRRRSHPRRLRPQEDVQMTAPLLSVRDLSVAFAQGGTTATAVDHISFDIAKGETVALVGKSGSGKSVSALSVLKLLPYPSASHPSGQILFDGKNLLALDEQELRSVRGNKITMIFQEPMTSLNPLHTIEQQIVEVLSLHQGMRDRPARERTLELLHEVGIRDPEKRLGAYPHQLSGGQRQRVMIAMALANEPELLIADEPTTALDVTVQAQILELLARLKAKNGMSMLFITHDLGIVRKIADRVCVMTKGKIVEIGPTEEIFANPQHEYTRHLLAAEPKGKPPAADACAKTVMSGKDVKVWFPIKQGFFRTTVDHVKAVDGIDVTVRAGQTLGVVGESGSGKTTLGLALCRMISSQGRIAFRWPATSTSCPTRDAAAAARVADRLPGPFGSLSPRMSVSEIIEEGLAIHEPSLSE